MDPPDEDRLRHLARASSLALDPTEYANVPAAVVAELRSVCLVLPESVEKQGWAGTQWRVRNRMYAYLSSLRPGGAAGGGWELGRSLLKRDLEAVATRVQEIAYAMAMNRNE